MFVGSRREATADGAGGQRRGGLAAGLHDQVAAAGAGQVEAVELAGVVAHASAARALAEELLAERQMPPTDMGRLVKVLFIVCDGQLFALFAF